MPDAFIEGRYLSPTTRRQFLKGVSATALMTGMISNDSPFIARSEISFDLLRGPYQDNGASPWYTVIPFGSDDQKLKFCFDSGTNFNWVTSQLCEPDGCKHYGGERFYFSKSKTFEWTDPEGKVADFGPWGTLLVAMGGADYARMPVNFSPRVRSTMFLAEKYDGVNFAQLDWDGAFALPSGSQWVMNRSSLVMADFLNAGVLSDRDPFVTYITNNKSGRCVFGKPPNIPYDRASHVFLPWEPNRAKANFAWSTALYEYAFGGFKFLNKQFCLDTGASEFKGDKDVMEATLRALKIRDYDLMLKLGKTDNGEIGEIRVRPAMYNVYIEEGRNKGKTISQFTVDVPVPDLIIVGSVLMDSLHTVFEYKISYDNAKKEYILDPVGTHIYNKEKGGPIQIVLSP